MVNTGITASSLFFSLWRWRHLLLGREVFEHTLLASQGLLGGCIADTRSVTIIPVRTVGRIAGRVMCLVIVTSISTSAALALGAGWARRSVLLRALDAVAKIVRILVCVLTSRLVALVTLEIGDRLVGQEAML